MIRFEVPFKFESNKVEDVPISGSTKPPIHYLTGKLLIAMPAMDDPYFQDSVILILDHDESKAVGVVINKPAGFIQFGKQVGKKKAEVWDNLQIPVYFGGPVDSELAMILHSCDITDYESSQVINEHFCVTSSLHILEDISKGEGPDKRLFSLGYASWAPGQLENELQANVWLVGEGSKDLVFDTDAQDIWLSAIQSIGIDPGLLSTKGGTA